LIDERAEESSSAFFVPEVFQGMSTRQKSCPVLVFTKSASAKAVEEMVHPHTPSDTHPPFRSMTTVELSFHYAAPAESAAGKAATVAVTPRRTS